MTLKDFDELNKYFTWIKLTDKNNKLLAYYSDKNNNFKTWTNGIKTDKEYYEQYKNKKVLSIKDIDFDINWQNNYVTYVLDIEEIK